MTAESRQGGRAATAARSRRAIALFFALSLAIGGLVARSANGRPVLPAAIWIALQLPLLVLTLSEFRQTRRRFELATLVVVALVAAVLALRRGSLDTAITGPSLLLIGHWGLRYLVGVWTRMTGLITAPMSLMGYLVPRWLMLMLLAAALLAAPIGTRAGVPDYRHNFGLHLVNCLHAALSSGCLVGTMTFEFGSDLSRFGQIVIYLLTQLSGFAFAAMGLALSAPLLRRPPLLRHVFAVLAVLQLAGSAVLWTAWRDGDTTSISDRTWWSLLHSASAMWNTGLTMRPDGLATYFQASRVFLPVTMLTIIGSLGVPLLVELLRAPGGDADRGTKSRLDGVATLDAMFAFILLAAGGAALWYFEHPASLLSDWRPPLPFEPSANRPSLVDLPSGRWAMSVFVSATIRSAGLQSIPVTSGTVIWPSYILLMILMFVGGGIAGTAGGLRTTLFSAGLAGRRRGIRWIGWLACGSAGWLMANALAAFALGCTTNAPTYDTTFEAVAAINSVGFSTGLTPHLTGAGRIVLAFVMLFGRVGPLIYWARTVQMLREKNREPQ